MRLHNITGILLLMVWMSSCSKETSIEKGITPNVSGCRVKSIVALDKTSGKALYAFNTAFTVTGNPKEIEAIDSLTSRADLIQPVVVRNDSVLLGDGQFFVMDRSGRPVKLQVKEDPADSTSQLLLFQYTYDTEGYLKEKTVSLPPIPVAVLSYVYTWSSGNLTKVEGKLNGGAAPVRIFLAEMEYEQSIEPKNFIYLFPDAVESFLYLNALNFGKKNKHLIKGMTVLYYDEKGIQTDRFVSAFREVKMSSDKQIQEWFVDGDSMDPYGIFDGRVRFDYLCK